MAGWVIALQNHSTWAVYALDFSSTISFSFCSLVDTPLVHTFNAVVKFIFVLSLSRLHPSTHAHIYTHPSGSLDAVKNGVNGNILSS